MVEKTAFAEANDVTLRHKMSQRHVVLYLKTWLALGEPADQSRRERRDEVMLRLLRLLRRPELWIVLWCAAAFLVDRSIYG